MVGRESLERYYQYCFAEKTRVPSERRLRFAVGGLNRSRRRMGTVAKFSDNNKNKNEDDRKSSGRVFL